MATFSPPPNQEEIVRDAEAPGTGKPTMPWVNWFNLVQKTIAGILTDADTGSDGSIDMGLWLDGGLGIDMGLRYG